MDDGTAHASQPEIPATGRVLGGRYRVGKLVRSGGMGSVYEGEHTTTGRRVALKLVHLRSPVSAELENRFEREARIASNVQSKHIVQVFDAGRDEVLGPFIAMELLRGEDLESRLARGGPLPPRVACEVAYQTARGLEKAHASNVAHRDLKPGNLFLVDSDEDDFLVKVLDFGIAKLFDGTEDANAKLTREGSALGTPQYMSPEQARGRTDIDARTDVYSLGAVLYEMIVGRPHVPELANYNQLVIHIATEPAPRISASLPDIDPRIDRLVADMLVGDRRDRLQTMRMARERLAMVLGNKGRSGSTSELSSGSFPAGREVSSVGFSSARVLAAPPAATELDAAADDESEEVHFFERESFGAQKAAPPAAPDLGVDPPLPDSMHGESVVLFDRASLHLPAATERTSSGAHVVDPRPSAPPVASIATPVSSVQLSPPIVPVLSSSRPRGSRRGILAAAAVAMVFLFVGSIRFVLGNGETDRKAAGGAEPASANRADGDAQSAAGAIDGGITAQPPP